MFGTRYSSSSELPAEWQSRSTARYWVVIFWCSVLAVLSAVVGVLLLVQDGVLNFAMAIFFGLIFGAGAILVFDSRVRKNKPLERLMNVVVSEGSIGLRVPYSIVQFAGYLTAVGSVCVFLAVGAFVAVSTVPPHLPTAVVLIILFSFPLCFIGSFVLGSFSRGELIIDAEGVYQRGWTFECWLPWSSMSGVQPVWIDGAQVWLLASVGDENWHGRQIARFWRQDRLPDGPLICIRARDLAVDIWIVYLLLGYYYLNEEAREELGTPAALERAERMSLEGWRT